MESQFNFLRVKDGRTYFARIAVVSDPEIEGVLLSATAGAQNSHTREHWLEAARLGARRAWDVHVELGGSRIGLTVTSVLGTETDTTDNTVEVAAFCAARKALGHSETEFVIEFDEVWVVKKLG